MQKNEEFISETVAQIQTFTANEYECARNKPMPNLVHGVVQSQISYILNTKFGDQLSFPNEVDLETMPQSTPDISVFPKKKLNIRTVLAREKDAPITTIELINHGQTVSELVQKAENLYFPFGVKSAWIVIPEFKAIQIVLPNDEKHYFDAGILTDPATGIQISIEQVFDNLIEKMQSIRYRHSK